MKKSSRRFRILLSLCLAMAMLLGMTLQVSAAEGRRVYNYAEWTDEAQREAQLNESFPAGWAYVTTSAGKYFLEFGKDGTEANLWQKGSKIASFQLTDANGNVIKLTFSKIKKDDTGSYAVAAGYSKAGGYNFGSVSADNVKALKDAGLTGIIINKNVYCW